MRVKAYSKGLSYLCTRQQSASCIYLQQKRCEKTTTKKNITNESLGKEHASFVFTHVCAALTFVCLVRTMTLNIVVVCLLLGGLFCVTTEPNVKDLDQLLLRLLRLDAKGCLFSGSFHGRRVNIAFLPHLCQNKSRILHFPSKQATPHP